MAVSLKDALDISKLSHAHANRLIVFAVIAVFGWLYYRGQSDSARQHEKALEICRDDNERYIKRISELEELVTYYVDGKIRQTEQIAKDKDSINRVLSTAVKKLSE